ncbi:hypothetical protein [Mucilaginibacter sp.]
MKTFIYFLLTTFISTGALFSALVTKGNHLINFAIAFGIWARFLYCWNQRFKEEEHRRRREQLFEDYLRQHR